MYVCVCVCVRSVHHYHSNILGQDIIVFTVLLFMPLSIRGRKPTQTDANINMQSWTYWIIQTFQFYFLLL